MKTYRVEYSRRIVNGVVFVKGKDEEEALRTFVEMAPYVKSPTEFVMPAILEHFKEFKVPAERRTPR